MNAIATAPALSARLIPRFSDRELDVIDWGIENLAFRIESAQRELERFAAEGGSDRGRLGWFDALSAGVLLIEAQFEDLFEDGLPEGFSDWADLGTALLHHSDWLLHSADEALEYFEDHRLGLRITALGAACFELARWIPADASPAKEEDPGRDVLPAHRTDRKTLAFAMT